MGFPPPKQREMESADSGTDGERVISVTVELHSVSSNTVVEGASSNFPVTVCFDLTLDVTHTCTHVLNTEPAECLLWSNVVASGEVVHYSLLLCVNCLAHNYELLNQMRLHFKKGFVHTPLMCPFLDCHTSSIPYYSTHVNPFAEQNRKSFQPLLEFRCA